MAGKASNSLLGRRVKPTWRGYVTDNNGKKFGDTDEPVLWFHRTDNKGNAVPYPEEAEIVAMWVEDGKVIVTIEDHLGRTRAGWLEFFLLVPVPPMKLKPGKTTKVE